jgi:hypothetical protein
MSSDAVDRLLSINPAEVLNSVSPIRQHSTILWRVTFAVFPAGYMRENFSVSHCHLQSCGWLAPERLAASLFCSCVGEATKLF